jgi:hypothetical protein
MNIIETIQLNIGDLRSQQASLKLQIKLMQRAAHKIQNLDSIIDQLKYLNAQAKDFISELVNSSFI